MSIQIITTNETHYDSVHSNTDLHLALMELAIDFELALRSIPAPTTAPGAHYNDTFELWHLCLDATVSIPVMALLFFLFIGLGLATLLQWLCTLLFSLLRGCKPKSEQLSASCEGCLVVYTPAEQHQDEEAVIDAKKAKVQMLKQVLLQHLIVSFNTLSKDNEVRSLLKTWIVQARADALQSFIKAKLLHSAFHTWRADTEDSCPRVHVQQQEVAVVDAVMKAAIRRARLVVLGDFVVVLHNLNKEMSVHSMLSQWVANAIAATHERIAKCHLHAEAQRCTWTPQTPPQSSDKVEVHTPPERSFGGWQGTRWVREVQGWVQCVEQPLPPSAVCA